MAYRRTHCYAMHQHLPYVPTPKRFWFSTSFNATKNLLNSCFPSRGEHLLRIYLGILVYLPCSKAQNTRKKPPEKNGSCLRRVRATSACLGAPSSSNPTKAPTFGRQLCREVALLQSGAPNCSWASSGGVDVPSYRWKLERSSAEQVVGN